MSFEGAGPRLAPFERIKGIMEQVARFQDVLIEPWLARGQPCVHWPDFDAQTFVRCSRNGKLVDQAPIERPGPVAELDADCVWIGSYDRHYGHFISEAVSRVPVAAARFPHLKQLFNVYAGFGGAQLEPHFRAILDWFRVPPNHVHLVTQKTRVKSLTAFSEPEPVGMRGVSADYLDILDANDAAHGVQKSGGGIVYVSRGKFDLARGRHAGENYMVKLLMQLGVKVIWPELMSVEEQIREMTKADNLVFAEGSAVYSRQLAGRSGQRAFVLRRRPGSGIGHALLASRVAHVRFIEAVSTNIAFRTLDGNILLSEGMALYDLDEVFGLWRALGIPLADVWDNEAYMAERNADMTGWLAVTHRAGQPRWRAPEPSRAHVRERFVEAGLGDLL